MDKKFANLRGEYSSSTDEEEKKKIKEEMFNNLKDRNNGSLTFSETLTINEVAYTVEELYSADGILNANESMNKMKTISDNARANASERNIYSPNKPYYIQKEEDDGTKETK